MSEATAAAGGVGVAQVVAVVCGAGVGLGIFLIVTGLRPGRGDPDGPAPARPGAGWRERTRRWRESRLGPRAAAAVAAAVVVGVATRWPAAALLAAAGAWGLPAVLGTDRAERARLGRIEGIATWAEMLRDTLAAAAGLEQSITVTAPSAPAAVRPQVQALAGRIQHGQRLVPALHAFADDLDDPVGDLVVAALVLAAEHQARQLADLLASLAAAAREQVGMRLRVAAGRAQVQTSVRTIVATTLAMAAGLVLLNRDYLRPYDSPAGQLVLILVGGVFALALAWLSRIAAWSTPARVLTRLDTLTPRPDTGGSGGVV
jgi:Flp pilus assembly protein TadB